jgi:hypothetical protein
MQIIGEQVLAEMAYSIENKKVINVMENFLYMF